MKCTDVQARRPLVIPSLVADAVGEDTSSIRSYRGRASDPTDPILSEGFKLTGAIPIGARTSFLNSMGDMVKRVRIERGSIIEQEDWLTESYALLIEKVSATSRLELFRMMDPKYYVHTSGALYGGMAPKATGVQESDLIESARMSNKEVLARSSGYSRNMATFMQNCIVLSEKLDNNRAAAAGQILSWVKSNVGLWSTIEEKYKDTRMKVAWGNMQGEETRVVGFLRMVRLLEIDVPASRGLTASYLAAHRDKAIPQGKVDQLYRKAERSDQA